MPSFGIRRFAECFTTRSARVDGDVETSGGESWNI
jgi:hypothetical protein